jgi:hypothetical protein
MISVREKDGRLHPENLGFKAQRTPRLFFGRTARAVVYGFGELSRSGETGSGCN